MPDLVPVEHDPFATTPVDYDPFVPPPAAPATPPAQNFAGPLLERIAPQPMPQDWAPTYAAKAAESLAQPLVKTYYSSSPMEAAQNTTEAILGMAGPLPAKGAGMGLAATLPFAARAAKALEPEIAPAAEQAITKGIRAYHGSPYDFEKFDLSKIGSGEGAQAYGHGLYFAENRKVAQDYKAALSDRGFKTGTGEVVPYGDAMQDITSHVQSASGLHPDQARKIANYVMDGVEVYGSPEKYAKEYDLPSSGQMGVAYKAALEKITERGLGKNPGRMYEVSIAADPDHFLHWDKPLSEQSEKVQKAFDYRPHTITDAEIAERRARGDNGTADFLESQRTYLDSRAKLKPAQEFNLNDPATIEKLRDAGIPGIKYLDQGSRNTGAYSVATKLGDSGPEYSVSGPGNITHGKFDTTEAARAFADKKNAEGQTHNYVVFDDKLIDIIKKYGIAGLIAGGAGHFSTTPVEHNPFSQNQM